MRGDNKNKKKTNFPFRILLTFFMLNINLLVFVGDDNNNNNIIFVVAIKRSVSFSHSTYDYHRVPQLNNSKNIRALIRDEKINKLRALTVVVGRARAQ